MELIQTKLGKFPGIEPIREALNLFPEIKRDSAVQSIRSTEIDDLKELRRDLLTSVRFKLAQGYERDSMLRLCDYLARGFEEKLGATGVTLVMLWDGVFENAYFLELRVCLVDEVAEAINELAKGWQDYKLESTALWALSRTQ